MKSFDEYWYAPEHSELRKLCAMGWAMRVWNASRDAILSEPVAYAVFASNGNIRIWCVDPTQVETLRQQYGEALQPLYAASQPAEQQQPDVSVLVGALGEKARPFHDIDPNWLYSVIRYARKSGFEPDVTEGLREMDEDEAFLVPNLYDTPQPAEQQPAADQFIATFRCENNGIVGTTNAKVHSVTRHDDGCIEVVIDHWPEQPAPAVQGEPVGWQFYKDGKWWPGDDRIKDHRKNTEEAGFRVRDVYAVPQPAPDVSALVEALEAIQRVATRKSTHTVIQAGIALGCIAAVCNVTLANYRKGAES